MENEEIQAFCDNVDKITEQMTETTAKAKQTLVEEGICTNDGELALEYR